LPDRNRLFMQVYADVTGLPVAVAASAQTPAVGAAMFAAVAAGPEAGGYASIAAAARRMAHLRDERYEPDPANRAAYEILYREYVRLHDLFGRGADPAMKTLKRLRFEVKEASPARIAAPVADGVA
jgi:L-ribulokinase